jgi:hypothetical protein
MLIVYLNLVPMIRMSRVIFPLFFMPSWRKQGQIYLYNFSVIFYVFHFYVRKFMSMEMFEYRYYCQKNDF